MAGKHEERSFMKKLLSVGASILLISSIGYCEQTKPAHELSYISFHLVADKESALSFKKTMAYGKQEELNLEQTAQLTIDDVDSAKLVPLNWPPEYVKQYKSRGFTPPSYKIGIKFTQQGRDKLNKITSENLNRRLGVIVDGKLLMAPIIKEPISGDEISIQGSFDTEEMKTFVERINKAKGH